MNSTYKGTTEVGFPIDACTRFAYEFLLAFFGAAYAASFLIPVALGSGPIGIIRGSLAALIQSKVYGAFVPAGSWFSIMTRVGMKWTTSITKYLITTSALEMLLRLLEKLSPCK